MAKTTVTDPLALITKAEDNLTSPQPLKGRTAKPPPESPKATTTMALPALGLKTTR